MRILVVSPEHADLPNAASEIAAIDRNHDAAILKGLVRDVDIEREIAESGPFDIFWWITHGTDSGVLLSDGLLSIQGVAEYTQASGAQLVVLNTCSSENVALEIVTSGPPDGIRPDIICTVAPVDNRDAIRKGSLLAAALVKAGDFYDAFSAVKVPGDFYRYLRGEVQYRRREPGNEPSLAELFRLIAGDQRLDQPGLIKEVKAVKDQMFALERRQTATENELVDVKSELNNVKGNLQALNITISERFQQGRVTLSRPVAILLAVAVLAVTLALLVTLFILYQGTPIDGRVGFSVFAIFYP